MRVWLTGSRSGQVRQQGITVPASSSLCIHLDRAVQHPDQQGSDMTDPEQSFAGPPLTVPYDTNIPRGCYDQLLITITGQFNPDANVFTVDICRGSDIAMHMKLHFSDDGGQNIVRNSMVSGEWGTEERELSCLPFARGNPFELKILCTSNEFKVTGNGDYLFEYKHRIQELDSINHLGIYNDVTLTGVSMDTLP
ncbi:galectin-3-like isoform X2 [Brienomyrus brachyistius]|uniref:galectin-3-like isoform X2 n=1 Tax=Brienomyrus brachyistius TaxID=42636 RepID=UPI0020B25782|nr:galectin-3-like isoform X2 [Brienomyrus brachyistius]